MTDTTNEVVLVVEDEASLRQMIVHVLQEAGYQVIEASNGKEGLESALKHHPGLILTDNKMPILDGIEMVAKLRKDSWGAHVHVIVMTAVDDITSLNQSLAAGVTDYVMKSDIGVNKLVALVQSRLQPAGT